MCICWIARSPRRDCWGSGYSIHLQSDRNFGASSKGLPNCSVDSIDSSQVRLDVEKIRPTFESHGEGQTAEPKSEPAMKCEHLTRLDVPNDVPVTTKLTMDLMEQAKSRDSEASNPGALTVNFSQPNRWVLPPVKLSAESPSNPRSILNRFRKHRHRKLRSQLLWPSALLLQVLQRRFDRIVLRSPIRCPQAMHLFQRPGMKTRSQRPFVPIRCEHGCKIGRSANAAKLN